MPRGGPRPNAGRPKGKKPKWYPESKKGDEQPETRQEVAVAAEKENLSPLDFMLREMNNTANAMDFRARMAQAAAPFVHARADAKGGKKNEKDEAAKKAVAGSFAPAPAPKVVPIKKQG